MDKLFKKIFKKGFQNQRLIKEYLGNGRIVTLYDFECPPRKVELIKGEKAINYLVDLDRIFKGRKIDYFTEIPRAIKNFKKEQKVLQEIKASGLNFRFVKIIADTNAYFLSPKSLELSGSLKIKAKFKEFKKRIKNEVPTYPVKTEVILLTDLIKKSNINYSKYFDEAMKLLKSGELVSEGIVDGQITRTNKHVGLFGKRARQFAIRTIASYATEGMLFNQLSKTKYFGNCIWLNFEETEKRVIEITNCLRRRNGLGKLPMLFP